MGENAEPLQTSTLVFRWLLRIALLIWAILWIWHGVAVLAGRGPAGIEPGARHVILLILVVLPALIVWWSELTAGIIMIVEFILAWIFAASMFAGHEYAGSLVFLILLPALVLGLLLILCWYNARPARKET